MVTSMATLDVQVVPRGDLDFVASSEDELAACTAQQLEVRHDSICKLVPTHTRCVLRTLVCSHYPFYGCRLSTSSIVAAASAARAG